MVEKISNNASTTLSAPVDGSTSPVSVTVSNVSAFPTTGNFRILIDNEVLLVTSVLSNTFTATRAQEETTIAAHLAGATVTQILTAGAVTQLLDDRVGTGTLSARPTGGVANRYYVASNGIGIDVDDGTDWYTYAGLCKVKKPPALSNFTWVNQGGATTTEDNHGILMYCPPAPSDSLRMMVKTPSTSPIDFSIAMLCNFPNANYSSAGLVVRESSSGKLINYYYSQTGTNTNITRWNNETTWNSNPSFVGSGWNTPVLFLRYKEDSTNRYFMSSFDNTNWITHASEARTTHLTANQIGFVGQLNGAGGLDMYTKLIHWQER